MATSNTFTWELTRDEIISAALRKLGVLAEGETASANQISTGATALNSMIMLFAADDGMPLWQIMQATENLVAAQKDYNVTYGLKVLQVLRKNISSGAQVDLKEESRTDFNLLNTSTTGTPVSYFVDQAIQTPVVSVWPKPDAAAAAAEQLVIVYQKEFDSFTVAGDTPAFPSYWTDAIIYGLAVRLAPEYSVPLEDRKLLLSEAKMYKDAAESFGGDTASMFFQREVR